MAHLDPERERKILEGDTETLATLFAPDDLREALAALAHDQWSGWTKYMFSKTSPTGEAGESIPLALVERWKRQMQTPYADLPDSEKESDRTEADRVIALLQAHFINVPR